MPPNRKYRACCAPPQFVNCIWCAGGQVPAVVNLDISGFADGTDPFLTDTLTTLNQRHTYSSGTCSRDIEYIVPDPPRDDITVRIRLHFGVFTPQDRILVNITVTQLTQLGGLKRFDETWQTIVPESPIDCVSARSDFELQGGIPLTDEYDTTGVLVTVNAA